MIALRKLCLAATAALGLLGVGTSAQAVTVDPGTSFISGASIWDYSVSSTVRRDVVDAVVPFRFGTLSIDLDAGHRNDEFKFIFSADRAGTLSGDLDFSIFLYNLNGAPVLPGLIDLEIFEDSGLVDLIQFYEQRVTETVTGLRITFVVQGQVVFGPGVTKTIHGRFLPTESAVVPLPAGLPLLLSGLGLLAVVRRRAA